MIARQRILLCIALCLFALAPLAAQEKPAAPAATPALFRLEAEKTVMYFFGSVHVGSPDMYPLPAAVMDAFAASDSLVVEVNVKAVPPGAAAGAFRDKLSYPASDSIEKHLSAEYREKLKAVLESFGLPYERFTSFKPALIDSLLTQLGAASLGYDPGSGIDVFFIDQAGEKTMPVLEIESFDEQVDMLRSIPEEAQIAMLAADLDGLPDLEKDLADIVAVWKKGDLDACYALEEKNLLDKPGLESVFTLLVTDRNKLMAERLKAMIKKGGKYFVVVGTSHLAGPGSVIELLRGYGYEVTRM
ncbi:MAG: TraB/GumN family protein [Spirochaetales bacterium]|nr:TraB/GumN family protein [Spirochaetales bacterium]